MQTTNDPLRTTKLMSSFKGRMQLASEAAAEEEVAKKDSPLSDPWHASTSRLHGRVDWDGHEYITSQQRQLQSLAALEHGRAIPSAIRRAI